MEGRRRRPEWDIRPRVVHNGFPCARIDLALRAPNLPDDVLRPHDDWRVLHARGEGCAHLAYLLGGDHAARVEGDLKASVIAARTDLLVQAKGSSFDLVPLAVPHDLGEDLSPPVVLGAVGTGPHSPLVAAVTARLAGVLGADPVLASVSRDDDEDGAVKETLQELGDHAPGAEQTLIRASAAAGVLDELPENGLLVLGAPGGSWWQRQFFGPGRRLMVKAPAGSVEVKAAPRRVFHAMTDLDALGAPMRAADARAVMHGDAAPVTVDGEIVGLIRRSVLDGASDDTPLGDLMDEPVFVHVDDPIEAITAVAPALDGAAVPVVDHTGRLVGGVALD